MPIKRDRQPRHPGHSNPGTAGRSASWREARCASAQVQRAFTGLGSGDTLSLILTVGTAQGPASLSGGALGSSVFSFQGIL